MLLNFASLVAAFLCFDQPTVIKIIAMIFIKGCSNHVNLTSDSAICPIDAETSGETKYKMKPITNCMCVAISANSAIFLSLAVNSFFEDFPRREFTTAKTNNNKAM